MRVKSNNGLVLLVLLLVGAIFGSLIGSAFSDMLPILNYGQSIGVDPVVVDLSAIVITFGLKLSLDVAGVIGIVIGCVVYMRL